ncbi:transporter [Microbacterium sp. B35-04]|uniref:APC family permease n=1 Tax=unclassified Microbacterium TaxID=2609290 RepID=UPI0013D0FE35|nr:MULTISPECIES: amino acid permease [unclassified Microbacterium]KAF2413204.1 transporter [Microbacterium sp. B35-04]KAF2417355.1 transporter [Microbacterium sp. B35-30]
MTSPSLQRRLGLGDAVFIGLGSMIGAGVFAVWAPAADAAGTGLLIGLAIAAVVAFGNATSSAQLAAAHPTSGGTYAYGRAELGPWWGYIAGWGFVVGKIASCAAMALTFAAYAAPSGWERPVAVAAVVVLTAVNGFGVTRTAGAARVIVVVSLGALAAGITAALSAGAMPEWLTAETLWAGGGYGILQSAGLLFFAFAGYARIATMGEEVRDPRRVIPRAIVIAFLIALAVYAVVAVAVLSALGPAGVAASTEPVAEAAVRSGWTWIGTVVRVGAAAASLGALLALIAGVSRTTFAMSREADLPRFLDRVHPRTHVPLRAEIAVGAVVVVLVALIDLRGAIGFSSFGVLLYYFVANVAARRQRGEARRYPAALQLVGAIGCLVLAVTLPWQSVVGGVVVVAAGIAYRAVRLRRRA